VRHEIQHEAFLVTGLDRTRAGAANQPDGIWRGNAKPDEQERRDRAGAPESASAVHQHPSALAEQKEESWSNLAPGMRESFVRRLDIDNRQMEPLDLEGANARAQIRNP
jgi:hypothetical protein